MQIGNISLEFTGHAGFLIEIPGKIIYIDPYKLSFQAEKEADIILITHSHYDHCSIEDLKKIVKNGTIVICSGDCCSKFNHLEEKVDLRVIEPGIEINVSGIKIKAVPAYNINKQFHSKEEFWNGYILEIEGKKIYHAGDTDLIPEMQNFGKIDVALLPVSGIYTMTAEEAFKAALIIKPSIAVPMHYGEIAGSNEDAYKFKDLCEGEGIRAEVLERK